MSKKSMPSQASGDQQPAVAIVGLFAFAATWFFASQLGITNTTILIPLYLCGAAGSMAVFNLYLQTNSTRWSEDLNQGNLERCITKFLSLLFTLAVITLLYALIPVFHTAFYKPAWDVARALALPFLLVAAFYIPWIDRRQVNPEDDLYHFGLLLRGQWQCTDRPQVFAHLRSWGVKAFFIPFLVAASADHLTLLSKEGIRFDSYFALYATSINLLYSIDVVFGSIGYIFTLRLLDSHVRSTDSTVLGWVSALICYPPFYTVILAKVLNYGSHDSWTSWLDGRPVLLVSWGFAVLLLHVVYVWSTLSFGLRFSNLSNRGIITTGAFRYSKHPAYLSKNLAWWLMAVPFASTRPFSEALGACLSLLAINGIYVLRAWTEERHLSADPEYLAYLERMRNQGVFGKIFAPTRTAS